MHRYIRRVSHRFPTQVGKPQVIKQGNFARRPMGSSDCYEVSNFPTARFLWRFFLALDWGPESRSIMGRCEDIFMPMHLSDFLSY